MSAHVLTPMAHQSDNSPVTRLVDTTIDSRRQMLVTELFKHIKEIQGIDDGYAFKLDRSEHIIRLVADYILFESRYSPQLTFAIVGEPHVEDFWLQVRRMEGGKARWYIGQCTIRYFPVFLDSGPVQRLNPEVGPL